MFLAGTGPALATGHNNHMRGRSLPCSSFFVCAPKPPPGRAPRPRSGIGLFRRRCRTWLSHTPRYSSWLRNSQRPACSHRLVPHRAEVRAWSPQLAAWCPMVLTYLCHVHDTIQGKTDLLGVVVFQNHALGLSPVERVQERLRLSETEAAPPSRTAMFGLWEVVTSRLRGGRTGGDLYCVCRAFRLHGRTITGCHNAVSLGGWEAQSGRRKKA